MRALKTNFDLYIAFYYRRNINSLIVLDLYFEFTHNKLKFDFQLKISC